MEGNALFVMPVGEAGRPGGGGDVCYCEHFEEIHKNAVHRKRRKRIGPALNILHVHAFVVVVVVVVVVVAASNIQFSSEAWLGMKLN